jgi:hypothetical protein
METDAFPFYQIKISVAVGGALSLSAVRRGGSTWPDYQSPMHFQRGVVCGLGLSSIAWASRSQAIRLSREVIDLETSSA